MSMLRFLPRLPTVRCASRPCWAGVQAYRAGLGVAGVCTGVGAGVALVVEPADAAAQPPGMTENRVLGGGAHRVAVTQFTVLSQNGKPSGESTFSSFDELCRWVVAHGYDGLELVRIHVLEYLTAGDTLPPPHTTAATTTTHTVLLCIRRGSMISAELLCLASPTKISWQ